MNEYVNEVNKIIRRACDDIVSLEKNGLKNNPDNIDEINIISSYYLTVLKAPLIIEGKKGHNAKITLNNDSFNSKNRLVLDEDPDKINNHVITLESDPLILQTKSGRKIILDEDPVSVLNKNGNRIILDEDPIVLANGVKKYILDEDPVFIKLESGKKLILDEDPKVLLEVDKNNDEVIDDFFSYSGSSLIFNDDIYVAKSPNNDKTYIFDEEPGSFLNEINSEIESNVDETSAVSGIHTILLDEDPASVVISGHSFQLDEDPVTIDVVNRIELDEDPASIVISGHSFQLDEDPESVVKNFHKNIVLDEDPITIEIE